MDDSEFLEPFSPRHFNHILLQVIGKAGSVLFDILPRTVLFVCDAWVSLFMWFNTMQCIHFFTKEPASDAHTEDMGSHDSSAADLVWAAHVESNASQTQDGALGDLVPDCDHCLSTTAGSHTTQCPANHLICLKCLFEHADVQLSQGDPDLLCLHPSECGLAFAFEDLQKLPQEVLWDVFSRFRPRTEAVPDVQERLPAILEADEEETEWVEDALLEAEEDEDGDEDDSDATLRPGEEVDEDDADATFRVEEAISTRQVSIRPRRATLVKLEEVDAEVSAEAYPVLEEGEYFSNHLAFDSDPLHFQISTAFMTEETPYSPPVTLQACSPQYTSTTVYTTSHIASSWDSTATFDSVTAPPLRRGPTSKFKPETHRASSAEPPDDCSWRRMQLDKAVARAKNDRENAQSRLRYARRKVKDGEWPPERLKKAEREREEAGQKQKEAEMALRDWANRSS